MILGLNNLRAAVRDLPGRQHVIITLERNGGMINRYELETPPPGFANNAEVVRLIERVVKFLLWAWGGWRLTLSGPAAYCEPILMAYRSGGARGFDADFMSRAYQRVFTAGMAAAHDAPAPRESGLLLGGHLDGCRIGFDLGASDYKLAAVKNGELVFSAEIPWDPKNQPDPQYHYKLINQGLKTAAAHLPRVDAIGGSSAGVIIDNQIMAASLFRAVPQAEFDRSVRPMFLQLQKQWNVPLEVLNDGDVTALAGAMSLGRHGMLGVAMGSSEAAGFQDRRGYLTGRLTELAFAPVDLNPAAAVDEWSGDAGVGALYFSQQAVNKLAPAAGISFPEGMGLPERLKEVQKRMEKEDPAARKIYETIGVYLGYTIPLYREFYEFDNLLTLGRVTSGAGGDIIIAKARQVLDKAFPELKDRVSLVVPDERSRRVGQAFAAASLPPTRQLNGSSKNIKS
jgi:predicted NBD/HSP70 family sugar kinase